MYLVINKCVTAVKVSNFSGQYLRNRSTLNIGVLGYIGIVQHKEHSPEGLSIPPGTPCIHYDINCTFLVTINKGNRLFWAYKLSTQAIKEDKFSEKKIFRIKFPEKSFQSEPPPVSCGRTDRQTRKKKLIVEFRNFVKVS